MFGDIYQYHNNQRCLEIYQNRNNQRCLGKNMNFGAMWTYDYKEIGHGYSHLIFMLIYGFGVYVYGKLA